MGREVAKEIFHRYRLTTDYKENFICLNRENLSKDFIDFHNERKDFENYIRTKKNPEGILDYVKLDRISNNKEYDSFYYYVKEPEKYYSYQELCNMNRKELETISYIYGLPTIMVVNSIMIKNIMKEQEEWFSDEATKLREESKKDSNSFEDAFKDIVKQAESQA
ncbi:MAG TPA: hypothetical protein PLU55_00560 [Candidatus Pacearchaeota archaeon]|nr:hypothetical protein [Candidatus Pacearchaeota archaeon]